MAEPVNINFNIRNCDSFIFEDKLELTLPKQSKGLIITFPDTNKLVFSEQGNTFPPFSSDIGYLGYDSHEILGDLDEWGFDTENDMFTANLDNLKNDVALNPSMFVDKDGNNASFNYTKFPSGVYKLEYSFIAGTSPDAEITQYQTTDYFLFNGTANLCLKNKLQQLFEFDLEISNVKHEYDKLKDEIMKIIMMIHISEFDFSNNEYEEANLKLVACDNLCLTGDLGYKYDTAR